MDISEVREILSEPPRGADWVALTEGIPIYEYLGRDLPPRRDLNRHRKADQLKS